MRSSCLPETGNHSLEAHNHKDHSADVIESLGCVATTKMLHLELFEALPGDICWLECVLYCFIELQVCRA